MDPKDSKGLGDALGLALTLPIATLIGFGMGYGLDALFHTGWLRYVFLVLGTAAGLISVIRESSGDT
jgi:F0F1-type ATP synthase assembly protein I